MLVTHVLSVFYFQLFKLGTGDLSFNISIIQGGSCCFASIFFITTTFDLKLLQVKKDMKSLFRVV